jgi:hypothetical protein
MLTTPVMKGYLFVEAYFAKKYRNLFDDVVSVLLISLWCGGWNLMCKYAQYFQVFRLENTGQQHSWD